MIGRIIKGIGGFYYVKADDKIYECHARGLLRRKVTPTVGDFADILTDGEKGSILDICQRKNVLIRPSVSNVDQIVLVSAFSSPSPDLRLIDKLLVTARKNDIDAILCFNKSDLKDTCSDEIVKTYEKAGYKVFVTCAKEGFEKNLLLPFLKGKTTAFTGLSGVGKSSLLSLIVGEKLETGEVSKIERGRHTTRHVELIEIDKDTYVFDTPGFSKLEIQEIGEEELKNYFPEMMPFEGKCRFRGCNHVKEPDCAVIEAVNQGIIARTRHESYKEFFEELKEKNKW